MDLSKQRCSHGWQHKGGVVQAQPLADSDQRSRIAKGFNLSLQSTPACDAALKSEPQHDAFWAIALPQQPPQTRHLLLHVLMTPTAMAAEMGTAHFDAQHQRAALLSVPSPPPPHAHDIIVTSNTPQPCTSPNCIGHMHHVRQPPPQWGSEGCRVHSCTRYRHIHHHHKLRSPIRQQPTQQNTTHQNLGTLLRVCLCLKGG